MASGYVYRLGYFFLNSTRQQCATPLVVGALIILVELIELSLFRGWEEWINVVLGAWLIGSAWLLDIANLVARANFFVIGPLVVLLALYEIRRARQNLENQTSDRSDA